MIYPLQHAINRNRVLAYASGQAVDRAMRRLHDGPCDAAESFHERMKTDPSNCRWCGAAAAEARAELEAADVDLLA